MFEYVGALHIHSHCSDGSGSLKRIIRAAKRSGLDFVVISDHNNMRIREEGQPGWYGDLLVIIGEEVSPPFNHYMAFGIHQEVRPDKKRAQANIDAVAAQGGIGFISHPDAFHRAYTEDSKIGSALRFGLAVYPWRDWQAEGFTGIEVWQYMYDWLKFLNHFNLLLHILTPQRFITGPDPRTLRRWDRLNMTRKVVGIGTLDAHARPRALGILPISSYRYLFGTIRTHILTPEPFCHDYKSDLETLLASFSHGSCFFANDRVADSSGFRFYIRSNDTTFHPGDQCPLAEETEAIVILPHQAEISIISNGKLIFSSSGESLCKPILNPGVIRVEVRKDNKPWIFSNPIWVA